MINSKKKGNAGENAWAHYLTDNGIKAFRDAGSGGGSRSKSDVNNSIDMTFEVKTCKKVNLRAVMDQTMRSATQHHNVGVAVIHLDNMPKDSWYIVMDSGDWMELIKKAPETRIAPVIEQDARSLKYALERAVGVLKVAIKEVENYAENK